jgi:hypothetical protein
MGTWSADTFGNDDACDWSAALEEVDDLSLVREAFDAVLEADDDYLEVDLACQALAACEVVARLKGKWGVRDAFTEPVDTWVESHKIEPPKALVQAALAVIDRILTPQSELLELWEEAGESEWRAAIDDLRERVR